MLAVTPVFIVPNSFFVCRSAGGLAGIDRSDVVLGGGGDGGGGASFGDEGAAQQRQAGFETRVGQLLTSTPGSAAVSIDGRGRDAGSIGGRAHTALGTSAAVAAAAGPAGLGRAVVSAEGVEQQRQSVSSLPARHGVATGVSPETSGNTARPAALSAASGLRRSSGRLLTWGGGGRPGGSVRTSKNKILGASGMRVLMPGEGARDYSSLLKGSESVRGRGLEARVATAEAEVGRRGEGCMLVAVVLALSLSACIDKM